MIISNTTPLINFAAIDRLDVLQQLFGKITIPHAVQAEFYEKGECYPSTVALKKVDFIPLQSDLLAHSLMQELDIGEAEAIALAVEKKAETILLDELAGRSVADYYQISCIGSIGCLILTKQRGHIPQIKPLLDAMRNKAQYWIYPKLYERVLSENNEN